MRGRWAQLAAPCPREHHELAANAFQILPLTSTSTFWYSSCKEQDSLIRLSLDFYFFLAPHIRGIVPVVEGDGVLTLNGRESKLWQCRINSRKLSVGCALFLVSLRLQPPSVSLFLVSLHLQPAASFLLPASLDLLPASVSPLPA
jgi:hypothetical protein